MFILIQLYSSEQTTKVKTKRVQQSDEHRLQLNDIRYGWRRSDTGRSRGCFISRDSFLARHGSVWFSGWHGGLFHRTHLNSLWFGHPVQRLRSLSGVKSPVVSLKVAQTAVWSVDLPHGPSNSRVNGNSKPGVHGNSTAWISGVWSVRVVTYRPSVDRPGVASHMRG